MTLNLLRSAIIHRNCAFIQPCINFNLLHPSINRSVLYRGTYAGCQQVTQNHEPNNFMSSALDMVKQKFWDPNLEDDHVENFQNEISLEPTPLLVMPEEIPVPIIHISSSDWPIINKTFLQAHGFTEEQISKSNEICCLDPILVQQCVQQVFSYPELCNLKSNRHFLLMLRNLPSIRNKIDYMRQHPELLASPSVYTLMMPDWDWKLFLHSAEVHVQYLRVKKFLAFKLDQKAMIIDLELRRHPNAYYATLLRAAEVMTLLDLEGISHQQLLGCLPVILYSVDMVDRQLKTLLEGNHVQGVHDKCILQMVLYFIEKEHNFSGEGIWSMQPRRRSKIKVEDDATPAKV